MEDMTGSEDSDAWWDNDSHIKIYRDLRLDRVIANSTALVHSDTRSNQLIPIFPKQII